MKSGKWIFGRTLGVALASACLVSLSVSACANASAPAADGGTQPAAQGGGSGMQMQGSGQTAGARPVDPRKLTKIQTSSADVAGAKGAVQVRYLNLPWGEKTFSYMEVGGDDYYSNRKWPVAHLTLARPATLGTTKLDAGDYAVVITPKGAAPSMTLSLVKFTPASAGGTFLVEGDVFTEVPKDGVEVASMPVAFEKGAPLVDHLVIEVAPSASGADMKLHYGDRTLTETFVAK